MALTAGSAARGGFVTLVGQGAKFAVQLTGLAVLSRLLSPADFGLVAMVTVIISVADLFRDFGLSTAAIQAESLNDRQRTNLFWINTGLGFVLCAGMILFAPVVSDIYGNAELEPITRLLALTFLINGLQTQYQVSLVRSYRFVSLTLTDVMAQACGLATAIVLAVLGYGVWSLAWQVLVTAVVLLVGRGLSAGWLPGRFRLRSGTRPFVTFGLHLLGTQTLVYLSTNVDTFLVGKQYGAATLGQYTRAFQILNIPINQMLAPLSNVAVPALARSAGDTGRTDRYLTSLQILVCGSVGLALGVLGGVADPLFAIILGPGWDQSAVFFQVLATAGFFQCASFVLFWVFTSRALTRQQLQYSLVSRSIMIGLLIWASFYSALWVAIAFSISSIVAFAIAVAWLHRVTPFPAARIIATTARYLVLAAIVGTGGYVICNLVNASTLGKLVLGIVVELVIVGMWYAVIPVGRRDFRTVLAVVRSARG